MSRRELLAFLSETQIDGNVPASGSIAGILKKMHHEMLAGLADATKDEENGITEYEGLMSARTKEVNALLTEIIAGAGQGCSFLETKGRPVHTVSFTFP